MLVLLFAPFIDRWMANKWVFSYTFSAPSTGFILLSCCIAIFVNISQFMCLGRFSATTFQVRCRCSAASFSVVAAPPAALRNLTAVTPRCSAGRRCTE